jgi:hypothetical protein
MALVLLFILTMFIFFIGYFEGAHELGMPRVKAVIYSLSWITVIYTVSIVLSYFINWANNS